jgi:hypothetical protein
MSQDATQHPDASVADPVRYARIFTDVEGQTHLSDEVLTFELVDYAPPAPPISVSALCVTTATPRAAAHSEVECHENADHATPTLCLAR